MTETMISFLSELEELVVRYGATLGYGHDDDGIHVGIGREDVCIGFPEVGSPGESIRSVLDSLRSPAIVFNCMVCGKGFVTVEECNACEESH